MIKKNFNQYTKKYFETNKINDFKKRISFI